jgi:hypothetical protein
MRYTCVYCTAIVYTVYNEKAEKFSSSCLDDEMQVVEEITNNFIHNL